MDDVELKKLQVEAWKTIVQVQQHFNDIEMRIRALAITVLTAVLGAAAIAVRDGTTLHVAHTAINLGMALLVIGVFIWLLFYFVDQIWYHRLLLGAVEQGRTLEGIFDADKIPGFGLTEAIKKASPYPVKLKIFKLKILEFEIHSPWKIRIFYYGVAALLAAAAVALGLSTVTESTQKPAARLHADVRHH